MATAGDADLSGSVTEEFEYKHTCLPCESEGYIKKAVGYCKNCREFLCQRCYDGHLIPSLTRGHVLVDEENMDNIATEAKDTSSNCSKRCPQHQDEFSNYHCPVHSFFGCHICFFKNHKTCTDVRYIPEVSQNITGTTEFQEFGNRLAKITKDGSQLIADIKTVKNANNTCFEKAVAGIKDFKKELLDAIEKLEKELIEKADRAKRERDAELSTLHDKVNSILTENQTIASKTEILLNKHRHCDLYTVMVQLKDKLLDLEDSLHAAEDDTRSEYLLKYSTYTELLESLKSPLGLGNLSETGMMTHIKTMITDVKHLRDVSCKTESDKKECRLAGSVLLPGDKLVLTDNFNNRVKLLDIRKSKIVAEMNVSSVPLGVCKVTNTQVAVACIGKQIVFVETDPSLSVSRELKVEGICRGVGYLEEKLVVSYVSPSKVEIMDLQGTVLKKIETDDKGQSIFNYPYQLTINPYNKMIYVSNCSLNNIVCMKLDGTVVTKYTDSEMQGPWQVITDKTGKMFACCRNSANIHQLTEDCKKVKVILTKAHGLSHPESIAFSEKDSTLYIGQESNDLKVFKLTFQRL